MNCIETDNLMNAGMIIHELGIAHPTYQDEAMIIVANEVMLQNAL